MEQYPPQKWDHKIGANISFNIWLRFQQLDANRSIIIIPSNIFQTSAAGGSNEMGLPSPS